MANAIKKIARSRRSHNNNKNFRQFIWNAEKRSEEKAKVKFGQMLAEEMKKDKDKKENKE